MFDGLVYLLPKSRSMGPLLEQSTDLTLTVETFVLREL